ncbi:MAG: T9SS type A sorting domain-containing protein, partial [Bacteroidia bacterium]
IFEINAALELNVFPNPNNGQFFITFNQHLQTATLLVYDGIGQLVHSENLPKAEQTTRELNLGNAPAGIYFVQVQLPDGQTRTRTLVIEK